MFLLGTRAPGAGTCRFSHGTDTFRLGTCPLDVGTCIRVLGISRFQVLRRPPELGTRAPGLGMRILNGILQGEATCSQQLTMKRWFSKTPTAKPQTQRNLKHQFPDGAAGRQDEQDELPSTHPANPVNPVNPVKIFDCASAAGKRLRPRRTMPRCWVPEPTRHCPGRDRPTHCSSS